MFLFMSYTYRIVLIPLIYSTIVVLLVYVCCHFFLMHLVYLTARIPCPLINSPVYYQDVFFATPDFLISRLSQLSREILTNTHER